MTSIFFSRDQPLELLSVWRGLKIVVGPLLEDRDDPVLAALDALDDELVGEHRLARAGRTGDQDRVPTRDAAPHHLVETRHPGREAMFERALGDRPPAA